MSKGGTCPQCKYYLFVKDEKEEEKGTTVWYECANRRCNYAIKTFFPKPERKR